MKFIARRIKIDELEKLDIQCATCNFWFDYSWKNALDSWGNEHIIDFLKARLYRRAKKRKSNKVLHRFCRFGGKIMGVFDQDHCAGMLIYGKHFLFPKTRAFKVYPPDHDCVFIGCLYVKSDYRGLGLGQRLLLSVERELIKKRINSLEIIGKRNQDQRKEKKLVPVKFLIKNGFYIHKNDSHYPLLRLDLDSIVRDFDLERVIKKHMPLNKRLEVPGRYYNR